MNLRLILFFSAVLFCIASPASAEIAETTEEAEAFYTAYRAVIEQAKDGEEMLPFLPEKILETIEGFKKEFSREDVDKLLQARLNMLQSITRIKVLQSEDSEKGYILHVEGIRTEDNEPNKGEVSLVKENGALKVEDEVWEVEKEPEPEEVAFTPVTEPGADDTASGTLDVDGRIVPLKYAYAMLQKNFGGKDAIWVLLSSAPTSFGDDTQRVHVDEGRLHYIVLLIRPDQRITSTMIYDNNFEKNFVSSAGGHILKAETFGPSVIAGRAFTEARNIGETTYQYEVEFKVTVLDEEHAQAMQPEPQQPVRPPEMNTMAANEVMRASFADDAKPDAQELIGSALSPKKPYTPTFQVFTEQQVRDAVRITASRNNAWVGYNTPEVQLYLPEADNSVYSLVEFHPVKLLDTEEKEVPFELEKGLYDHDCCCTEIRFLAKTEEGEFDPNRKSVEFSRAVGSVKIQYPLVVETVIVKKDQPIPEGMEITLEGPFVSYTEEGLDLPETPPFSPIRPVRAYDASGKQIKQHGYSAATATQTEDGKRTTKNTMAFYGNIAELQLDVVRERAEFELSYDLPPAEKLKEE